MTLIAGGLLLFLSIWYVILQRWQLGMVLLLLYLPFAGVVTMALYPSSLPVLFKDFYFVIPAYLAFWLSRKDVVPVASMPPSVSFTVLALASMVSIQAFNPGLASWLVAAIGAKVWLFYLPLLFLAFAIVESRYDLAQLLRLMVVLAWIPCCAGILEWLACMTFGYEETMFAIYGQAAEGATQNFARFEVGGELFRIPSTFTFVTQYFGYTLSMIVAAYMLSRLDESAGWRGFAAVTMWLAVLASFLSGARAAYVFVPLLLLLTFWLDGRFRGGAKALFMLAPVLLLALYVAGIDAGKLYVLMRELLGTYSTDIAAQGLLDAIVSSPWGTGTGMNTGPARYAFDDPESFIGIENYYAKAVVELGIPGLMIVAGLFFVIAKRGYGIHSRLRDAGLRSCASALLAFVVIIALNSFKGWQIDLDPVNVYFWVFSGFLLKLGHLEDLPQASEGAGSREGKTRPAMPGFA